MTTEISAADSGRTLHQTAYASPAALEAEFRDAFADTWQYVGPSAKLLQSGDHIVATVGRTPVVITRGQNGQLHGMVNVCRHRLHPVALEAGSSRILMCRYHGWSYRLDGSLLNAPRCRDELELDKASHGLLPVAVDTLGPWVFANLDPNAPALADSVDDCRAFVDAMVQGSDRFTYRERLTMEIAGNWKLFVENGIECYHCPLIHSESFAQAFKVNVGEYISEVHRHAVTQFGPPKLVPVQLPAGREPNGFEFLFLPPNSLIGMDDFAMFALSVLPTGPTTCTLVTDIYIDERMPADALEEWIAVYYSQTMSEDALAVERQQAGFSSGAVPHGRLLGESENAIRWFEHWLHSRTAY